MQHHRPLPLAAVLVLLAAGVAAADDPPAVDRLPRVVRATAATAEPLVIDRRRPLYDAAVPARMELVVLLSHPRPARPARAAGGGNAGGAGGMLEGVGSAPPAPAADPVSAWFDAREAELTALGRAKARELTGDTPPPVAVLRNNPVTGTDHAEALEDGGYVRRAGRRDVVDGRRVWAALYARRSRPEAARLGDVTERVDVTFAPEADAAGVVRLNATARPSVTPTEAPAGADAATWEAAVDRRRRWLRAEADRLLEFRLNLRRIRAPQEAAQAFDRDRPYELRLRVPYWGEDRTFTVVLEGEAEARTEGGLEEPASDADDAADERPQTPADQLAAAIAGPWTMWVEYPPHGKLHGFAYFKRDGHLFVATDFPDGTSVGDRIGANFRVRDGKVHGRVTFRKRVLPLDTGRFVVDVRRDGRAMRGHVLDADGEPAAKIAFEPLKTVVESIEVRPAGNGALDFPTMTRDWQYVVVNGNKPRVELRIKGKDLPRYIGGDAGNLYNSAVGGDRVGLGDPSVTWHYWIANPRGTEMRAWFWLNFSPARFTRPGRKTLWINDTPVEFDLAYDNYAAPPPAKVEHLMFVNTSGEAGGYGRDDTAVTVEDDLVLAAQFDRPPGDDAIRPALRVERDGQPVYTFPPATVLLRRSDTAGDSYVSRGFRLGEAADPPRGDAATQPAARPHAFQSGDVIVAELDGVTTRIVLHTSTKGRQVRPRIRFTTDPDGEQWVGGTYAGQTRIDLLPVGQEFWVEADYITQQRDRRKTLALRWAGGSAEVELFRVDTGRNVYRGGPFLVDPPPVAATQPADGAR